jgi:hypothetical protein
MTQFDYLYKGGSTIYILDLPEANYDQKDLKITLRQIQGKCNLYVNPEVIPEYGNKSLWKAQRGSSKSIIIPFAERTPPLRTIKVTDF